MACLKVFKAYAFKSSSGDAVYQTIIWSNKTVSCNCPGWTRRVAEDGSRSCRHTRYIDMGVAEMADEFVSCKAYPPGDSPPSAVVIPKRKQAKAAPQPSKPAVEPVKMDRSFDLSSL